MRTRVEFTRVAKQGRRFTTSGLIIIAARSGSATPRLGVTVSRKVGKSVRRNRLKRLLREYFRLNKTRFPAHADYVVIVRPEQTIRRLADVEAQFASFFEHDARRRRD